MFFHQPASDSQALVLVKGRQLVGAAAHTGQYSEMSQTVPRHLEHFSMQVKESHLSSQLRRVVDNSGKAKTHPYQL